VTTSRRWSIRTGLIAGAIIAAGCAGGGVLDRHFALNRKADAERSWRGVRQNVKLQLAEQLVDAGKFRDARMTLNEVIAGGDGDARAEVLLARIELAEGRIAAARQAVDRARSGGAAGAEFEYLAGQVEARFGDFGAALGAYRRAAAADPNDADYLLAQAEMLVRLDRPAEGLSLVRSRLPDFADHIGLRLFVAHTCELLKLDEAAVNAYESALRIAGNDRSIRESLGLALERLGRNEDAVRVLTPVVSSPSDASAMTNPAQRPSRPARRAFVRACMGLGDARRAQATLRELLREDDGDLESWSLLSRVAIAMGDARLAAEAARELARRGGADTDAWLLAALSSLQQGDHTSALRSVSAALDANPHNPIAFCTLARIQNAVGDHEAARRSVERALRLDPDCQIAAEMRQELADAGSISSGRDTFSGSTR